jgi:ABC-type sugar transport system permease subunit
MRRSRQGEWSAYGFIALPLLVIGLFVVLPAFGGIALSFFHFDGSTEKPPAFLGLGNYRRLFFQEALFWGTFRNTFVFALSVVPLTVCLGCLFALALNARWFIGKALVRTLLFLPTVVSIVAVGFVIQWILNPSFGLLNRFLDMLGIPPQAWLGSPRLAMPCLVAVAVWQGLGFATVIYLAALQQVPQACREAASLDGATPMQQALHVDWPLVAPTTLFLLVTGFIGAFQVFDLVYVMTGGGPANSTNVLNSLLYRKFLDSQLGYAASISVTLFAVVLGVTLLHVRMLKRSVE